MHAPQTILRRRYRITRTLAMGGMSVVYEAVDEKQRRVVAIKQILAITDRAAARRFDREAALLARVTHPGVVEVYEAFHEAGLPTLVMEYLDGRTLHELVPPGACLPPIPALQMVRTLAEILEHLHGQDPPIVFRDFKPTNVMVMDDGRLKLIDFGIAWTATGAAKTQAVGTPGYAPPEQYHTLDVCDPRMDVYALGATAYRLLTGQDPPPATARIARGAALPALESVQPPLPPEAVRLVNRMMGLHPRERHQSAGDVAVAIRRMLGDV